MQSFSVLAAPLGAAVAREFAAEGRLRTETIEGKGYGPLSPKRVVAWREFGTTPWALEDD
jgi:hypothetical protein